MNSIPTWVLVGLAACHPLIAQPRFDADMARQLESGVAGLMTRARVPGASVAIVQHGEVNPPLVGAFIRLSKNADGTPIFVLNAESLEIPQKYTFTRSR